MTATDTEKNGNWELYPQGSSERFAIVMQMADELSASDTRVFPQEYEGDLKFLDACKKFWETYTGKKDGREVLTDVFVHNANLELGNSLIVGTNTSVWVTPGSTPRRLTQVDHFVSGGRVLGLIHTHPVHSTAPSSFLDGVADMLFKGSLDKEVPRFSYGDFIAFLLRNVRLLAENNKHSPCEFVIDNKGIGVLIATRDTYTRFEQYKSGCIKTKDGKKVGIEELKTALIAQNSSPKSMYGIKKDTLSKWGIVYYGLDFPSNRFRKLLS